MKATMRPTPSSWMRGAMSTSTIAATLAAGSSPTARSAAMPPSDAPTMAGGVASSAHTARRSSA
jgi:hypothetical protein